MCTRVAFLQIHQRIRFPVSATRSHHLRSCSAVEACVGCAGCGVCLTDVWAPHSNYTRRCARTCPQISFRYQHDPVCAAAQLSASEAARANILRAGGYEARPPAKRLIVSAACWPRIGAQHGRT